jgi:hypothetical protein
MCARMQYRIKRTRKQQALNMGAAAAGCSRGRWRGHMTGTPGWDASAGRDAGSLVHSKPHAACRHATRALTPPPHTHTHPLHGMLGMPSPLTVRGLPLPALPPHPVGEQWGGLSLQTRALPAAIETWQHQHSRLLQLPLQRRCQWHAPAAAYWCCLQLGAAGRAHAQGFH